MPLCHSAHLIRDSVRRLGDSMMPVCDSAHPLREPHRPLHDSAQPLRGSTVALHGANGTLQLRKDALHKWKLSGRHGGRPCRLFNPCVQFPNGEAV
jgi:hypothetical protein